MIRESSSEDTVRGRLRATRAGNESNGTMGKQSCCAAAIDVLNTTYASMAECAREDDNANQGVFWSHGGRLALLCYLRGLKTSRSSSPWRSPVYRDGGNRLPTSARQGFISCLGALPAGSRTIPCHMGEKNRHDKRLRDCAECAVPQKTNMRVCSSVNGRRSQHAQDCVLTDNGIVGHYMQALLRSTRKARTFRLKTTSTRIQKVP